VKYLFVHQNFPGQYLHVVRHLLKDERNEVLFITEPNQNVIPGVRRIFYQMPLQDPAAQESIPQQARDFTRAAARAEAVARTARNLKALGFSPDIMVGHHGWGELLDLPEVWPQVPLLGYFEYFYTAEGRDAGFDPEFPMAEGTAARIRSMNIINHLALDLGQHGQTPTQWQMQTYPEWAQRQMRVLSEGADLDQCRPDPDARLRTFTLNGFTVDPGERLVTYVVRNLEPYRGFHSFMRALPRLLRERPDVRVIAVGGDDVSYGARLADGCWRAHFQQRLAGQYDASRVLFPGQVPYADYIRLLQRSDAHVYLTYPFVVSWSLREALACGCALVAADVDPVREFISDGRNGLLAPCLDADAIAERVLEVLEDERLARRLRTGARRYAERHLDLHDHIAAFGERVTELLG
jgi:glycosyltransferase involved in cell wall biosynthesis